MGTALNIFGKVLPDIFRPLEEAFSSPASLEFLFQRYGWRVEVTDQAYGLIQDRSNLVSALKSFHDAVDPIIASLDNSADSLFPDQELAEILEAGKSVFDAVRSPSLSDSTGLVAPLDDPRFWQDVGSHLIQDLLVQYLRRRIPKAYLLASVVGVIRYDRIAQVDQTHIEYIRTSIDPSQLGKLVDNPLEAVKRFYMWGQSDGPFEHQRLMVVLEKVAKAIGFFAAPISTAGRDFAGSATGSSFSAVSTEDGVRLAILNDITEQDVTVFEIALEILPAQRDTDVEPSGLVVLPILRGLSNSSARLSDNTIIEGQVEVDSDDLLASVVSPDGFDWLSDNPNATIDLALRRSPTSAPVTFGDSDGARIQLNSGSFGVSFKGAGTSADFSIRTSAEEANGRAGLEAVIPLGQADSFVKDTIRRDEISASFSGSVSLSSQDGLRFSGGSISGIEIPGNIKLGAVTIRDLALGLVRREEAQGSGAGIQLTSTVCAELGPLTVSIRKLGAKLDFVHYSNEELINSNSNIDPIFGNFDLELRFVRPDGVGISVDGGGFSGGGFLEFDSDNNRYVGALELTFKEKIALSAIGILTTALPNNSDGYSLLIVISAEFNPIQLGYGFTLNGVGGLLGLNRETNTDRLRTGLRDQTLESILFPKNIVANASRIISDLTNVFPASANRFLFGPVVKIGWGAPTVLTIDVGLILEVPEPVKLALVGVLRAQLPESKKLLQLRVNFLGVVNFQQERLSFDASLFDSKLLKFTLSGDMAMRLTWGKNPNFLITVGGFHPAYEPPPMSLPQIRRLTIQLLAGKNPRITLESYFAITSNTTQVGAKAELYAAAGPFNVYGFISFDALFQVSPFYFITDVNAMLALRRETRSIASIKLALTLEGTTPWKAKGTARLKLFWFLTVKIRFSKTFGRSEDTRLDDIAVLPLLEAELGNSGNWQAALPPRREMLVSVRELDVSSDHIVVHPFGSLSVSQKIVPFNVDVDTVGHQKPRDGRRFEVTSLSIGNQPQTSRPTKEQFAPAQFFEKTDEEKLKSKSFEELDSGAAVTATEALTGDHVIRRDVQYKLSYVDSQRNLLRAPRPVFPDAVAFNAWSDSGAVSRSALSARSGGQTSLAPGSVSVVDDKFVLVNVDDLRMIDNTQTPAGESEAAAMLRALVAKDPTSLGKVQAVPLYEAQPESR